MQRDIKFRGQAVNALGWIYGGSIIKFKDGEEILTYMPNMGKKCVADHDDIDDITNIEGCFYKVENVCLFTGIKDKNGIEIYEGDIIEREVFGGEVVGKIVWKDTGITGFWLAVKNDGGTNFYSIGRGQYDDDDGELCNDIVIGNIFENRELLEYV